MKIKGKADAFFNLNSEKSFQNEKNLKNKQETEKNHSAVKKSNNALTRSKIIYFKDLLISGKEKDCAKKAG